MKQYVIVGNGIAAAGCIEGIRSRDKSTKITVISREKYPVYCRPLISYYLEGKTELSKMGYRSESFYDDNGCEVLYGESAAQIDYNEMTLKLSGGSMVPFSSLCIAAGSSPFIPPFDGLDTVENRFSFMTMEDTLALEKALTAKTRVLIIGAGLIGLKCAEGIKNRVKSITICDLAENILSSILDKDTAPLAEKHLKESGITFMLGDSVKKFDKNRAEMKSGNEVEFDLLVTAVGVRSNTSLAAEAGIKVNRGIIVNDSMQTDFSDIYAAGDCTEGYDITLGSNRVLALLPNAYMQGFTAGANMAGGEQTFNKAIPMNSISFFGMHIMTAGSYITEKDGGTVHIEQGSDYIRKYFMRDGLLKGYIFIGKIERSGIYTALIREQTPLETVNFDLLEKNASFMAFSQENRRRRFGGVV